MQLGSRHLADYGAVRSRYDFTQRQLMARLILRAYTKTTYRGVRNFFPSRERFDGTGIEHDALSLRGRTQVSNQTKL